MNVYIHSLPTHVAPCGPDSGKTKICEGEQRDERYPDRQYGVGGGNDGREKEGLSRKTSQRIEKT